MGAYEGQQIKIECHSEAYPKSINYWTKEKGDIVPQGTVNLFVCLRNDFHPCRSLSWTPTTLPEQSLGFNYTLTIKCTYNNCVLHNLFTEQFNEFFNTFHYQIKSDDVWQSLQKPFIRKIIMMGLLCGFRKHTTGFESYYQFNSCERIPQLSLNINSFLF